MPEPREPVPVLLAIDNGLSETKAFWNVAGEPVQLMRLSPEIIEVQSENLLESGLLGGRPEDNALIEIIDGRLFAVGKQARDLRGKSPVEETKYQMSVYKILATVGAIATRLGVTRLELTIATLLPFSEYQDRKEFIELLKEQLREFNFRKTPIRCKIESVAVKPEGAGISISYMHREANFKDQNTLVLMVGHRDASLLPFEEGKPLTGMGDQLGDQLGFLELQKQVVTRAALNLSARNQVRLPEYLFRAKAEPEYIQRIAEMAVTGTEIKKKVARLQEAITASQKWYISTLTHWIKATLGPFLSTVDRVIISGGTALYLQEDLVEFFSALPRLHDPDSIIWGGLESQAEIEAWLGSEIDTELAVRLADVYGLYVDTMARFPNLGPGETESATELDESEESLAVATTSEELTDTEPTNGKAKAGSRRQAKDVKLPVVPKQRQGAAKRS
ncbi:ParM/StbA family protein [Phormidium sp. FACHB-592]|uniref:ParM/StbA family protein n=1 Tax=Stenomitos frigidus AS-A4 TaxID=2933935 RepID=A0ABV0KSS5_9CYAN|nr:ParM/StbA family protein [Phormidium sp. FACHB-592]MBD2078258.1 ParM/StbA family protein [Phormidium sp. FACHB-592]